MRTWMGLGGLALLALAGCQPSSVSGSYLAHYGNGAALMELTQGQQQVMGSITLITIKSDGQAERHDVSIMGGAVDVNGHSLVLTVKSNELFTQAQNVSGQIAGQSIDMQAPWGTSHFVLAKPGEFDAAVNNAVAAGKQQQQIQAQAQQMVDDNKHVTELTQSLAAYNARIESNPNGPDMARNQEEQLLSEAQKDLGILKNLEAQNKEIPANQLRFRIGQLAFQMGQIKFHVGQALSQGHEHLSGFDQRLASSPCFANARIDRCDALGEQKMRYVKVRGKVISSLAQLSADMQKNSSAMDAINKQAGN